MITFSHRLEFTHPPFDAPRDVRDAVVVHAQIAQLDDSLPSLHHHHKVSPGEDCSRSGLHDLSNGTNENPSVQSPL